MSSTKDGSQISSSTGLNVVLTPIKVAELVRQLAEAQYESKVLRHRIESHHRESDFFQHGTINQHDGGSTGSLAVENEHLYTSNGMGDTVSINYTTRHQNECSEGANVTKDMSGSIFACGEHQSCPPECCSTKPPSTCRPAVGADEKLTVAREGVNATCSDASTNHWKKKYARLKHFHDKTMTESDAQLREVQQLVFRISEEQEALYHRHEIRILQQKLEHERSHRLLLETNMKSLKEEAAKWKERYLNFVEEPAVHWFRTVAGDVRVSAKYGCALGNEKQQQVVDGLNETNYTSKSHDSIAVPAVDVCTMPRRYPIAQHRGCVSAALLNVGGDSIDQGEHHFIQQPPYSFEGKIGAHTETVGGHELCLRMHSSQRSVGVQVSCGMATAETQTEPGSPSAVPLRRLCGDSLRTNCEAACSRLDLWATDPSGVVTPTFTPTGTVPLLTSTHHIPHNSRVPPAVPVEAGANPVGRTCCLPMCHIRSKGNSSPAPDQSVALPMTSRQLPTVPISVEEDNCASDDAHSYRKCLEENIARHGQLVQAVAKLQQQVQLAVKKP